MIVSILVAAANHHVIGKHNQLLWKMPADMKYFKTLTTGHHVLMGRKTFESIGKPLPDRTNQVLTRNADLTIEGCTTIQTAEEGISIAKDSNENELFVIGGAQIYRSTMHLCQRIYFTKIYADFAGDAYFPEIDANIWRETSKEFHKADEKNPYDYEFIIFERG